MPCAYFDAGTCRSCSLLDVAYGDQLAGKQARARELIDAFAGPDRRSIDWLAPVASETAGFRTKAKLVIGGTADAPTLGILDGEQHGVDLEGCPIVAEPIRSVLPTLAAFITMARLVPYDIPARRGELKYLIVTTNARGELMLRFVLRSTESIGRIRKHLPALRARLTQLRVVTVNLLPEHKAVLEGEDELWLTDERALELPFDDLTLSLLPRSFVQTNESIAARLYATGAAWAAELAPASAWDLYCGVGGFALHLAAARRSLRSSEAASRNGPFRVTGVELSEDAVASATMAAASANLDAAFIAADATQWALAQASAPDLVVVNPPRRGLGPELAGWLEASGVRHVLYSSCNAESLARDLAAMPSLRPTRAQVFDMFPHTAHFETLVLLERA
ncbi:23S rRNA (uracil(747)-C(5))-methyltransferase [Gryllotalpicola protaetiae]|uniref:23S rRNA (Uracil(747)-C(5))-methyltransferase n=1 Tax=Gryllotalpicola protaetiae TaxID=2419771 RepID=A0A387BM30_9MICO|nr:methyltransferase domain-containing protein [Gryllotalpicola protaetiae]AYG05245.1 23S rRNA (uracil(747)-C(5))-methyltransferase [Gryllotalpicola protaetiae]